tara:strand:- start:40300 stop:41175 length:876 start_codon:yes stop_codon:yes gene_type:complete
MDTKKQKYSVFFCGISKNCVETISSNLKFLDSFFIHSEFNSFGVFVDSDSTDGSKTLLEEFVQDLDNSIYENLDKLEDSYNNRIERIQISRNKCLELMSTFGKDKNIVYIPLDLDLDLFKYSSVESFESLILYCINKNKQNGIFPFSRPYYYDIFALRASNWVNINSQYWVQKFKKNIKFGSFIINYFLIFKHQITPSNYESKKSNIRSAFGGIGIYKLDNKIPYYELSKKNPENVSEHVKFNYHFDELEILTNWKVPAPNEHLEYRLLSSKEKIKYFFKTIFFDFANTNK